jgi:DNA primase
MDAIMLRQAGYQALAVMGSSLSPVAASLLRLWTTAAVVYPDNVVPDEKAFEKALKWIPVLESVGVTAVFPSRPYENSTCEDPAKLLQLDPQWLHHQIETAVDGLIGRDDNTYVLDIQNIGG